MLSTLSVRTALPPGLCCRARRALGCHPAGLYTLRARRAGLPAGSLRGSAFLTLFLSADAPPRLCTSPRSLSSLNNPAGNKVSTPLGNAVINPCTKVTLCDAMQPGSTCCVQVNDTAHPGTARWISCGKTPIYATLGGVGTSMGVILQEGPDCGYVFAPNQKVQASISFKCDRSATGFGRVAADTTAFMKQAAAVGGAGASYAPGGASKGPRFEPSLFCNLNFTWSTSLVCGLPIPAANRGSSWCVSLCSSSSSYPQRKHLRPAPLHVPGVTGSDIAWICGCRGWAVILVLLGVGAAYFGGGAYMNSKQPGADASMFNNIPNKE